MLQYKGFSIPGDFILFMRAIAGIIKWSGITRKTGFNNVVRSLEKPPHPITTTASDLDYLKKTHRILYYILVRVIHHRNPCMIASLVLFDICKKRNIDCVLVVGAEKANGGISGHSWIEADGLPVNEDSAFLEKFTRMKEV
ncbi:MAG: lasso peptide biosynthesis B2 protein [Clostridia bacterium]|nr:lasso peptide biosynthesis B2 protein [Clostridia bacterium]MBN2882183.1 lasso peptide biosynthesis B2 protein [Clostridia bacterium]